MHASLVVHHLSAQGTSSEMHASSLMPQLEMMVNVSGHILCQPLQQMLADARPWPMSGKRKCSLRALAWRSPAPCGPARRTLLSHHADDIFPELPQPPSHTSCMAIIKLKSSATCSAQGSVVLAHVVHHGHIPKLCREPQCSIFVDNVPISDRCSSDQPRVSPIRILGNYVMCWWSLAQHDAGRSALT